MWGSKIWWADLGWKVVKFWVAAFLAFKAAKLATDLGLPSFKVTDWLDLTRIAVLLVVFGLVERLLTIAWKPEEPAKKAES